MEFVSDHLRINLTNLAKKVLETDFVIFKSSANRNITYSTYVNRVIANYDCDFPLNEALLRHPCDTDSRVIRLQNEAIDLLGSLSPEEYLPTTTKPTIAKYVRCLLETFARLPFIEREKLILKKDIIRPIQSAIQSKKKISLLYRGERFLIDPISIAPAKEGTFQYLVGINGQTICSIRLSRIEKIRLVGTSKEVSVNTIHQINEALSESGPTFIAAPKTIVKVRFTPNGLQSYQYSVIHRPMHIDTEDELTYLFHCSEMQAIYFFFRFAGDVEILEPISLREKFIALYRSGLSAYK